MGQERIKIWIEPELYRECGPSIAWTWRNILAGLGLHWEQVSLPESAHITYGTHESQHRAHPRLEMHADRSLWNNPSRGKWPSLHWNSDDHCREHDVIFDLFWLITGQSEQHSPKNVHGQFDLEDVLDRARPLHLTAAASHLIQELGRRIQQRSPCPVVARWPGGKGMAACAGHDVDYPEVIRWLEPMRILKKRGLRHSGTALSMLIGTRTHWNFANWIHAEQKLGIRSAFYFASRKGSLVQYARGTPDPFYNVRDTQFQAVFRQLAQEGFEVGLHASYRAYSDSNAMHREKTTLEEVSGQIVDGCRHHYWHLDPQNPDSTLKMHGAIGLKYDCSLTHERYVGWRRCLSWPFFPFNTSDSQEVSTLQLPTGWMDDQLFGHKKDNPGDRHTILEGLADTVSSQEGVLMVDVHDYVFDDQLYPGWARAYFDLFATLATRSDVWFATPREVAAHWRCRYLDILNSSEGLKDGYAEAR